MASLIKAKKIRIILREKNNIIYLPELDAGFLKWYSKYFGTKVPKPTTPNNMNIVERALNTYT